MKNPKNYRPIAELHNISKTFERVILNRITEYCETKNILRLSQHNFGPNHSTKDIILKLLFENSLKQLKTCVIFLDISKAFDLVNHRILSYLGFRGHINNLLERYLCVRKFCLKSESKYS